MPVSVAPQAPKHAKAWRIASIGVLWCGLAACATVPASPQVAVHDAPGVAQDAAVPLIAESQASATQARDEINSAQPAQAAGQPDDTLAAAAPDPSPAETQPVPPEVPVTLACMSAAPSAPSMARWSKLPVAASTPFVSWRLASGGKFRRPVSVQS
mgnify:CR=1 FL=1